MPTEEDFNKYSMIIEKDRTWIRKIIKNDFKGNIKADYYLEKKWILNTNTSNIIT